MDKDERRAGTRSRYPSLTLLALSALVLILAAMVRTLIREPPPLQVCRLPDGTVLRLEAVTRGPEHRFVLGRYWERLLSPLQPPGARSRFGATFCTYGRTDPATVVFWTTWNANSPLTNWTRTVAFNESGEEVEVLPRPFESWLHTGAKIRGWVVPAFPRRGATVGLRIYVHGDRTPVAEFRVPNPDPGPHRTWTAAPLPASQRDGELDVALTRLTTGRVAPARVPSPYRDLHWTHAVFRLREHGRPTDRWEPIGMTLSDATGNRIVLWPSIHYQEGSEAHLAFCGNLPPSETAWKLRAEFVPVRRFDPADLWQVRGVRARSPWGTGPFTAADRRRGLRLRVAVEPSGGGPGFAFLRLEVRASPRREGLRIALVRAIDDRGREDRIDQDPIMRFLLPSLETADYRLEMIRPVGRTLERMDWPHAGSYSYLVRSPDGAKTLDLTFAVVKSRFAEFIAKPSRR